MCAREFGSVAAAYGLYVYVILDGIRRSQRTHNENATAKANREKKRGQNEMSRKSN